MLIRICLHPIDLTSSQCCGRYVAHIRGNAETYMHEQLGIPLEDVGPVRKKALALANQVISSITLPQWHARRQSVTSIILFTRSTTDDCNVN